MHRAIRLYDNYHEAKWVGMVGNSVFVYYDWEYINNVLAYHHSTDIQVRKMAEHELECAGNELGVEKADWLEEAFYCFFFNDHQNKSLEYKKLLFEMLWNWTSNMEEI